MSKSEMGKWEILQNCKRKKRMMLQNEWVIRNLKWCFGRIWQSGKTKQVKRMRMRMRLQKMGDEEINLR
jgi:hypothetical protein